MNKRLDADLFDWVDFWGRALDQAYPGRSPLGRLKEEGFTDLPNFGSTMPRGVMTRCPRHVSRLNVVMPGIPKAYSKVLCKRYITREPITSTERIHLNRAHAFIQGALSVLKQGPQT